MNAAQFQNKFNSLVLTKFDALGDQLLVEFINDTISFYLKNKKVAFLQKYSSKLGQAFNVMTIRDCTIELISLVLRKTNLSSTLDIYKQSIFDYFIEKGIDFESDPPALSKQTIDILANTIFARREELQRILTDMVLELTNDKILLDYNYSVEMVMSSNTSMKVMTPILMLELFLKVNEDSNGWNYSGRSI